MGVNTHVILAISLAVAVAAVTNEEGAGPHGRRLHHHPHTHTHSHPRQSLPAPPYAVQMEPLVQYSQRDPLYHQRQHNITNHNSIEEKVLRIDPDSEGTNLAESYGVVDSHQQQYDYSQGYYREPEPIIEIIIKESNETLPAPPPPPVQPVKPTKEPVHVFYVKYKKNPKGKGEDDIIYEAPIPAITPPTEEEHDHEQDSAPQVSDTVYEAATAPPPPSTTLRTIIRPDSEVYHGGNLKVTFGETEVKGHDAAYDESSAPEPSIALPHKEAQSRESSVLSPHASIKRQGTYQTIPQEVYDRNPPKVQASNFQSSEGRFQQSPTQHQQFKHNQQKVNFPRQAPALPQPSFRPQHTGALFGSQQQFHQPQQFNHRPQFQQQATQVQQRQVPRPQGNVYSTLQSPVQNPQQRPQFRPSTPQFDQRPVQYSQPQRQQPQDSQHRQQAAAQNQFHSQPINVPNQDYNRQQQQGFPSLQPQNTPIPLPSRPLHPQFAHHYNQQINLAQQQRLNFVPSTHQPQPQPTLQSQTLPNQQHYQQQYRVPQQVVNIPKQPSTSQPLPSYQPSTPSPQDVSDSNPHIVSPSVVGFPDGEVIKSISQLEEHQFQPQLQKNQFQHSEQPTIEQINQLNQLRSQQFGQNNQQHVNQQQLYLQQQLQQQHPQQQPAMKQTSQEQIQQQQLQQQQIQQQQIQQQQIQQQQLQRQKILQQQIQQQQNQHQQTQQQQHFTNNDFASQYNLAKTRQNSAQYSHPNLVSTTSQPVKSTTVAYQTKYNQIYSSPSTTPTPTEATPTSTTEDPEKSKEKQKKFNENLAALPDEVPDDIREQLLSSGILGNADISILDYDKVGDIPIENLPPEALENFYGAGSAPVPAVVAPDGAPMEDSAPAESKDVEMKVVHYDPSTEEGKTVEDSYIKDDATQVDSVILNDSKYNRYLPLKVSGSNFPLPDPSILAGRKVNSVVVLAPVDYDFVKQAEEEEERTGRSAPVQVQGVRFIAGNILKNLIKDPTAENYKSWLAKEKSTPTDRQSVVLLVVSPEDAPDSDERPKEIFMYDIVSGSLSRLRGELSSTFVEVAESNAQSQELDGLQDTEGAASALHPIRVAPPLAMLDNQAVATGLKVAQDTEDNIIYQAPTISSGYSKTAVQ